MMPPPDDESPPAVAPNELDLLWMVVVAIAAMAHPLLFAVAMTVWGIYIFHCVLPGSLHWRIGGVHSPRSPGRGRETPPPRPTRRC